MASKTLNFIFKILKDGQGAEKTAKDLDTLEKKGKGAQSRFNLLDGVMLKAGGAVYDFGISALKSIPALVNQGVQADRSRKALEAYAGGAHNAEKTLDAMKKATGGALSEMDLMASATRLLSMGLAKNAGEAANLTDIAVTLGATMGKGPQEAFEEFTLLLANQSILRLDTFGISAGLVRQRMQELAKEGIEPADRNARFMIATMEAANLKMDDLAAAGFEATSSLDKMAAITEDAKLGVADFLADGLMPWIDGIMGVKDALTEQQGHLVSTTATYAEYQEQVATLPFYFDELTEAQYKTQKSEEGLREAVELGMITQDGWQDRLMATSQKTDEATTATDTLKLSIIGLSEAEIGRTALKNLEAALESGIIDEDEYNLLLIDISTSILGVSDAQVFVSKRMQEYEKLLASGAIDAEQYWKMVRDLNQQIKSMPTETTSTIRVRTIYTSSGKKTVSGTAIGGVPEGWQHGTQFMVDGQAGVDVVPVSFNATRGEVVTVTPVGQIPPAGDVNQSMQIYGGIHLDGVGSTSDVFSQLSDMMI